MQDNFISLKKKKPEIYTSFIITLYNETIFCQFNKCLLCACGDKNLKHSYTMLEFSTLLQCRESCPNAWLHYATAKRPCRQSSLSYSASAVL